CHGAGGGDVEGGHECCVGGDAGVAGGREHLVSRVLGAQRQDDGVLARARTEDQDSHHATLPRPVRRGTGTVVGMPRRISTDDGRSALAAVAAAASPARTDLATAVRYLLQLLAEKAPGNSVEVRV